jgi:LPS O-antigen subunit length determinant protein (WzzB/FepE family)
MNIDSDLMNSNQKNIDGIELEDLWGAFYDFRRLILATTLAFGFIGLIYSFTLTPTYQASALVVQADQKSSSSQFGSSLSGLAALAGVQVDSPDPVRTQIEIFKSRQFIEKFIAEEDLLPLLFSDDWDSQKKSWMVNPPPSIQEGYSRYYKSMSVRPKGDLYLILFEMSDPLIASDLTNKSIRRLNDYSRNKTILETEKSIGFLEEQINETNIANAQKFLFSLIEEQTKNKMLASVREEYVFEVIDPAIRPGGMHSPNRTQLTIIGSLIGFSFTYFFGVLVNIFGVNIPYLAKHIETLKS